MRDPNVPWGPSYWTPRASLGPQGPCFVFFLFAAFTQVSATAIARTAFLGLLLLPSYFPHPPLYSSLSSLNIIYGPEIRGPPTRGPPWGSFQAETL